MITLTFVSSEDRIVRRDCATEVIPNSRIIVVEDAKEVSVGRGIRAG